MKGKRPSTVNSRNLSKLKKSKRYWQFYNFECEIEKSISLHSLFYFSNQVFNHYFCLGGRGFTRSKNDYELKHVWGKVGPADLFSPTDSLHINTKIYFLGFYILKGTKIDLYTSPGQKIPTLNKRCYCFSSSLKIYIFTYFFRTNCQD